MLPAVVFSMGTTATSASSARRAATVARTLAKPVRRPSRSRPARNFWAARWPLECSAPARARRTRPPASAERCADCWATEWLMISWKTRRTRFAETPSWRATPSTASRTRRSRSGSWMLAALRSLARPISSTTPNRWAISRTISASMSSRLRRRSPRSGVCGLTPRMYPGRGPSGGAEPGSGPGARLTGEQGTQLLERQRRGEARALDQGAAEPGEGGTLLRGLDPLGDDRDAEAATDRDERLGEAGGLAVGAEVADEAAVDLEEVDGQAAELAEGRAAGAEVVEGEVDPQPLQRPQPAGDRLAVDAAAALGELDDQRVGGESRARERGPHGAADVAGDELAAADVDADRDRNSRLHPERGDLRAGGEEHPGADRQQQVALLELGEEGVGEEQPVARVVPAEQRLDRDRAAALELDDRLVVEDELALLEGAGELGAVLEAAADQLVHPRLVDAHPPLAALLAAVHGDIGAAEQLLATGLAGARQRHPHGAAHHHRARPEVDRAGQGLDDALRDREGVVHRGEVVEVDGEPVAAGPGGDVAETHA